MKHGYLLGAALGAALLSSPAAAQSDHGRMDRDRTVTHRDMARHADTRMHDRMDRDRLRDSDDRMDRGRMDRRCGSMSRHRMMMMHSRCRAVMHRHHHHHGM
jgi:hypothetical protein